MPTLTTAELLWGVRQHPKRGPKPALSLERIVDTAITMADADGLANLSMQRLAERLGFTKMSLYRYVPGRAELMALMLDISLGAPPEPTPELPWRDRLTAWTVAIHDKYLAHPWAIELTIGARLFGPNEIGWLEEALGALIDTGLTGPERLDTVVLLNGHARNLAQQRVPNPDDLEQQLVRQFAEVLATHGDRYPQSVAAFADTDTSGRNNALHFGIERILDGLASLIEARR